MSRKSSTNLTGRIPCIFKTKGVLGLWYRSSQLNQHISFFTHPTAAYGIVPVNWTEISLFFRHRTADYGIDPVNWTEISLFSEIQQLMISRKRQTARGDTDSLSLSLSLPITIVSSSMGKWRTTLLSQSHAGRRNPAGKININIVLFPSFDSITRTVVASIRPRLLSLNRRSILCVCVCVCLCVCVWKQIKTTRIALKVRSQDTRGTYSCISCVCYYEKIFVDKAIQKSVFREQKHTKRYTGLYNEDNEPTIWVVQEQEKTVSPSRWYVLVRLLTWLLYSIDKKRNFVSIFNWT